MLRGHGTWQESQPFDVHVNVNIPRGRPPRDWERYGMVLVSAVFFRIPMMGQAEIFKAKVLPDQDSQHLSP